MPSYQYYCESCGKYFEQNNKVENRDKSQCPHCDNTIDNARIYGVPSISFVGAGFFVNDYRGR